MVIMIAQMVQMNKTVPCNFFTFFLGGGGGGGNHIRVTPGLPVMYMYNE